MKSIFERTTFISRFCVFLLHPNNIGVLDVHRRRNYRTSPQRCAEWLSQRGHEPLLEHVQGTIRFDITRDRRIDHWFLSINKGDVTVSQEERAADCVVHLDGATSDQVARRETSGWSAWLRGALTIDGDLLLLSAVERVLPEQHGARHPRRAARAAAGQS